MFNLFKSEKDKTMESIKKVIIVWYEACTLLIDENSLKQPRPMVGAILFFLGSIDNLCQAKNIKDTDFGTLAIELLKTMGFHKDITVPILTNFYTKNHKNEFALNANIEGGRKISEFLSGKNKNAPLGFSVLVAEWAKEPDLNVDEIPLFGL